jgi:hypothetical protein
MNGSSAKPGREDLVGEIEVVKDRIAAVYHQLGELAARFCVKQGPIARSLVLRLSPLLERLTNELALIEERLERERDTVWDPVEEWLDKR